MFFPNRSLHSKRPCVVSALWHWFWGIFLNMSYSKLFFQFGDAKKQENEWRTKALSQKDPPTLKTKKNFFERWMWMCLEVEGFQSVPKSSYKIVNLSSKPHPFLERFLNFWVFPHLMFGWIHLRSKSFVNEILGFLRISSRNTTFCTYYFESFAIKPI